MQNEVRLPRLLNGNGQEERRLYPSALSLTLMKNAVSTAHMALPEEDGLPPVLSFVEIYTLKGSAGLFRVSQQDTPATGNGGIDLLHAICTLHDSVWNNQLDANGNLLETDFDGTVAEYMAAILAKQRTARWQLGTCEDTGDWKKSGLNHDHLDDLLMEMAQDRPGYMLTYDFSTSPWTVSFVACADSVNAECRLTRNMKDGRRRCTRTGMVNRLYLTIKSEEKKDTAPATWSGGPDQGEPTGIVTADEDKVTETGVTYRVYDHLASQAEHGVMEGTAEIDLADVPDVDDWVAAFFRDHAQPISQASADAWELVKATGEPWDQYDLGKYARIALKRDGFPAEGPIEQIRYADLLAEPEMAQVDLTRKLPKFSERLSSLKSAQDAARRGGGGGGGSAKAKEVTHWAQVVQHILEELEGTGITQLWESGIELDAEQGVTLYSLYQGLSDQYAAIKIANDAIALRVQVGDVATQLAVEMGNVSISGGNLVVDGMITAGSLAAAIAALQTLTVNANASFQGPFSVGASSALFGGDVSVTGTLTAGNGAVIANSTGIQTPLLYIGQNYGIYASGVAELSGVLMGGNTATWQSRSVVSGVTASKTGVPGVGQLVDDISVSYTTIYYLGRI